MGNFIADYLQYNAGNEVPRAFHIWGGLTLLSAVVTKKVYISQGYFTHYPLLYSCLIADQGDRKSTAKDIARSILAETFPTIPIGPSVTTREAITKYLGSEEATRTYMDEKGTLIEYRPFVLFINELKNFLSVNPAGMIDFLTDIYGQKQFRVETKNKGIDVIENPALVFMACETKTWIVKKLKEDLLTGGFSRRVNMVYVKDNTAIIPIPVISAESRAALLRIQDHLRKVSTIVGEFAWHPEAKEFFIAWYTANKKSLPEDPILRGYRKTKDEQLFKVSMLLALSEEDPKLVLTVDCLERGLAILDSIEASLPSLTLAAGRNELAVPQQRLLELLESHDGILPEKEVLRVTGTDMQPFEQDSVIRFLITTEQIHRVRLQLNGGIARECLLMHWRFIKGLKDGSITQEKRV